MADPRLNSIHLEAGRRDEFRHAREMLLASRGEITRRAEEHEDSAPENSHTLTDHDDSRPPAGQEFVLLDQDAVYPLKVGVNTIGRMPDNDVVLKDPYVSRRHCAVLVHAGSSCELHDVASRNGTFLNGRLLNGPTRIVSGDEIRMCEHQLVFVNRANVPADGDGVTRAD